MAGDDPRRGDPAERRQLRQLRVAAGALILSAILLQVIGDVVIRGFFNPNFHIDDLALGTLVGALLAVLGIETLARWLPK